MVGQNKCVSSFQCLCKNCRTLSQHSRVAAGVEACILVINSAAAPPSGSYLVPSGRLHMRRKELTDCFCALAPRPVCCGACRLRCWAARWGRAAMGARAAGWCVPVSVHALHFTLGTCRRFGIVGHSFCYPVLFAWPSQLNLLLGGKANAKASQTLKAIPPRGISGCKLGLWAWL